MRGPNEPADSAPVLGPVVREVKPAADPVREFEQATDRPLIADQTKALDSVMETLRKKWGGVISQGHGDDWKDIE